MPTEFTLSISDYKEAGRETGAVALAHQLQTLMLMEPGTLPNAPDCGVGIGLFRHEFADESTLSVITARITDQLLRFLPNDMVTDISVQTVDVDGRGKVLAVKFVLDKTKTSDASGQSPHKSSPASAGQVPYSASQDPNKRALSPDNQAAISAITAIFASSGDKGGKLLSKFVVS
jgi:hypothetical protein